MKIHYISPISLANGPGRRMVVWTSGCSIGCKGCFNPTTHPAAGTEMRPEEIAGIWESNRAAYDLDGLTISGGEPTDQSEELGILCRAVRKTCDSIVVFSGRYQTQICKMGDFSFLKSIDVLIAGPYMASRPESGRLYGSDNKELILLTDRHKAEEFHFHDTEIVFSQNGEMLISGFPPADLSF